MTHETISLCDREFDFTLVLSGVTELTDELMDSLVEAGCDDATPCLVSGKIHLDFTRSAHSLDDAIQSAIRDVGKANFDAKEFK